MKTITITCHQLNIGTAHMCLGEKYFCTPIGDGNWRIQRAKSRSTVIATADIYALGEKEFVNIKNYTEEEAIEHGFIIDWTNYDDAEDHPEKGCDFAVEPDNGPNGGMQDYPDMTVEEVIDELAKSGWELDNERQALLTGTEIGKSTWMKRVF